jgi:hypothetical protein
VKKSDVLELLRDEPEELDIDKFIYTLWFRRKIDLALREADETEGIPHEEVMRELDEWLKDGERTMAPRGEE